MPTEIDQATRNLIEREQRLLGSDKVPLLNLRFLGELETLNALRGRAEIIGIAAVDDDYGIGRGPNIPWKSPSDHARFQKVTFGGILIMGRITADSIGKRLPGRTVISVSGSGTPSPFAEHVAKAPDEALETALKMQGSRIFVAGGATIYKALQHRMDRLDLTHVPGRHGCDVIFPIQPRDLFREVRHDQRTYKNGEKLQHSTWLLPK